MHLIYTHLLCVLLNYGIHFHHQPDIDDPIINSFSPSLSPVLTCLLIWYSVSGSCTRSPPVQSLKTTNLLLSLFFFKSFNDVGCWKDNSDIEKFCWLPPRILNKIDFHVWEDLENKDKYDLISLSNFNSISYERPSSSVWASCIHKSFLQFIPCLAEIQSLHYLTHSHINTHTHSEDWRRTCSVSGLLPPRPSSLSLLPSQSSCEQIPLLVSRGLFYTSFSFLSTTFHSHSPLEVHFKICLLNKEQFWWIVHIFSLHHITLNFGEGGENQKRLRYNLL